MKSKRNKDHDALVTEPDEGRKKKRATERRCDKDVRTFQQNCKKRLFWLPSSSLNASDSYNPTAEQPSSWKRTIHEDLARAHKSINPQIRAPRVGSDRIRWQLKTAHQNKYNISRTILSSQVHIAIVVDRGIALDSRIRYRTSGQALGSPFRATQFKKTNKARVRLLPLNRAIGEPKLDRIGGNPLPRQRVIEMVRASQDAFDFSKGAEVPATTSVRKKKSKNIT